MVQCYHKGPSKREARGLESEKEDVKVESEIKLVLFEDGELGP